MGRFQRSLALAKESYAVMKKTPSLMTFPLLSGFVTLMISISFFVPMYVVTGGKDLEKVNPAVGYPLLFAFYFVTYFVVIFFNSALVSCAYDTLMGKPTSFMDGLRNAARHLPAILGWTLIASTVGMLLHLASERLGIVGKIVVMLIGAAWNIVTFFVVPIIVIQQGSPVASIKKSGGLLKKTWGENLIGSAGIGMVLGLLAVLPFIPLVAAFALGGVVAGIAVAGLSLLYWIGLAVIGSSMQGVYTTALFVYAETGATPSGFTSDYITRAFEPKAPSTMDKLRRR